MESTIGQWWSKTSEWLNEQSWFQQLKSQWDELDAQNRLYVQLVAAGAGALVVAYVIFGFISSVHRLRDEVNEKSELLTMLQSSNDELRRLKETSANVSGAASTEPWPAYFDGMANASGLAKDGYTISDPKPGASSDVSKEVLFDIVVKHASIRQVVKFAQALETGPRPVKLRNLTIDTIPDGTGYLDTQLSVSAFSLANPK